MSSKKSSKETFPAIDLSSCGLIQYEPSSLQLRQVNFVYGRNGSGKSTLAKLIQMGCGTQYDVRVFDGFDSLINEDQQLDAIALGGSNVEIQKKINSLREEIANDEEKLEEGGVLGKQLSAATSGKDSAEGAYHSAMAAAAKIIKEMNPRIASTQYNRVDFEKDLGDVDFEDCSEAEVKALKLEIQHDSKTDPKTDPGTLTIPEFWLVKAFGNLNDVLSQSLTQRAVLQGIGNDSKKQQFARNGMDVHKRGVDTICAFCGGTITEERWEALDSLFDETVERFEAEMTKQLRELDELKNQISQVSIPDQAFRPIFHVRAAEIRNTWNECVQQSTDTIADIEKRIVERQRNIFQQSHPIPISEEKLATISSRFQKVQQDYRELWQQNQKYCENIEQERKNAERQLRMHFVAVQTRERGIRSLQAEYKAAKKNFDDVSSEVAEVKSGIDSKRDECKKLIDDMTDETQLAHEVNEYLKSVGSAGFELTRTEKLGESKGQYQIRDIDTNDIRPVTCLSTGEKNIIAFLYFMESLNAPRESDDPLLVVLDDPMTSNDDTYQYLIISMINRFYEGLRNIDEKKRYCLVLLTHNAYFYLNVKPYGHGNLQRNMHSLHLHKVNRVTNIRIIDDSAHDITTAYDELWSDLYFAYENNRPSIMWNTLRRIITSFCEFTRIDWKSLVESKKDDDFTINTINGALLKALNINSHELVNFETDLGGCTRDDLINYLKLFFSGQGYDDHFESYSEKYRLSPENGDNDRPTQ